MDLYEIGDSREAAHLAWEAVKVAASHKEDNSVRPRYLTAAYHLLALGTYPDSLDETVEDTNLTLDRLTRSSTRIMYGTEPARWIGLRQRIALAAGGWDESGDGDRTRLARSKPLIRKIAARLLDETLTVLKEKRADLPEFAPSPYQHASDVQVRPQRQKYRFPPPISISTKQLAVRAILAAGFMVTVAGFLSGEFRLPEAPQPAALATKPPTSGSSLCADNASSIGRVGWFPDRNVYTSASRPDHATLNSERDDPNVGDERAFFGVRLASDTGHPWQQQMTVKGNTEYIIRIFVRNDAAETPKDLDALDTTAMVDLPVCTGRVINLWAYLTSSTTNPAQIGDGIQLSCAHRFNIAYERGSLRLDRNALPRPVYLRDDIFTSKGVRLSSSSARDGVVPAGYKNDLYVTFKVRIQV